ncbi:MAG: hypothetical protein AAF589_04025 [Planctomycetota bacterium]
MTRFQTAFVVSLVLLASSLAATADAQYYYRGYNGGYHASTAAEGYARGMADAVRSQGQKNLMDSRAAINREEARSKYIDNRTKSTNAYWERRRIYEENMAEIRYERNLKRQAQRDRQMLTQLTPQQLNPTTGVVDWPALLEEEQYDEFRKPLTDLFAKRGQYGELNSADYLEAKELVREFRAAVTANKRTYPDAAVSNALRFLLKLNRELDNNLG